MLDIAIIGAGPAGTSAAAEILRTNPNLNIQIFENDKQVGSPLQCGEGISDNALNFMEIEPQDNFIVARTDRLTLRSPSQFKTKKAPSLYLPGYALNRQEFDRHLASIVYELAGTEDIIKTSSPVRKIMRVDDHFELDVNGETVETKFILGCDGPAAISAHYMGYTRQIVTKGKELWLELPDDSFKDDGMNFYFDPAKFKHGYAWIFPKDHEYKTANVGLITREGDANTLLDEFIENMGLTNCPTIDYSPTQQMVRWVIPNGGPRPEIHTDGMLLAGDAAGITNCLFDGGIFSAMASGRTAGKVAAEACAANDFSKKYLSRYLTALESLQNPLRPTRTAPYTHKSSRDLVKGTDVFYGLSEKQMNTVCEWLVKQQGEEGLGDLTTIKPSIALATRFVAEVGFTVSPLKLMNIAKAFSQTKWWGW